MATHTYWRFNWGAADGGANIALAEVELRGSVGGADQCSGGTAGGTNINGSFPAANAFDNNNSTDYQATGTTGTLSYQFASPVDVLEYSLKASASLNVNLCPFSWTLEYSDNGTTWTIAAYGRTQGSWVAGEQRVFAVTPNSKGLLITPMVEQTPATPKVSSLRHATPVGPKAIAGKATVNGVVQVGIVVAVYSTATKEYIGHTTTASDGTYSIPCGQWQDVFAIAFNPTTYQPIALDRLVPA